MDISRRTMLGALTCAPLLGATSPTASALGVVSDSRSLFTPHRYIARGTVFTRSVANMPIAANSAELSRTMATMPQAFAGKAGFPWLTTSTNTESYNIPIYVVDSRAGSVPTKTFTVDHYECKGDPVVHNTNIPCPPHAKPAYGGDMSLAIYDMGTGIMREYFHCLPTSDGFAAATAAWTQLGAPITAQTLAAKDFSMQVTKGSSSVVKMHNPLSQIGLRELAEGVINHAISFTFADYDPLASWPAKQSDGRWTSSPAPRAGQWFRLPPYLDLGKLNLRPMTLLVCRALQRYGGYAADHNMWCHAVNIESPFSIPGGTKENTIDPIMRLYDATTDCGTIVNDLPWHLMEWAPVDWKGTAQATPAATPLQYVGGWARSVTGTLRETGTTSVRRHTLLQDASATTGKSARVTWTGTMRNPTSTTGTYEVVPRVQSRGARVRLTVYVDNTAVASMHSLDPRTLHIRLSPGSHTVRVVFDLLAPMDAQRNDIITLSSWARQ